MLMQYELKILKKYKEKLFIKHILFIISFLMDKSTSVQITENSIVVDTSFFIDLCQQQLWALRVQKFIKENNTTVVMPSDVEQEYNHYKQRSGADDNDVPIQYYGIEDLIQKDRISIMEVLTKGFREQFEEGPEDFYRTSSPFRIKSTFTPLTRTDKALVQITRELALEDKIVGIATTDYGILFTIDGMRDREKLNIGIYSPRNSPTHEAFSALDTKILVSGNVYNGLYKTALKDNTMRYLAVAKDIHIGGGVYFDIAFGILIQRLILKPLPKIENVYYLPIVFVNTLEPEENIMKFARYQHFNRFRSFIGYCREMPSALSVIEHEPVSILELKSLGNKFRNREINGDDLYNFGIKNLQNAKESNLPRIEDWHLYVHDHLSVGKLEQLRRQIRLYQ